MFNNSERFNWPDEKGGSAMFLGAVVRTLKGSYDAVSARKKLKEYQQELATDLLVHFPVYERFLATERLLMAEYQIELTKMKLRQGTLEEQIRLKERMNQEMKKAAGNAQAELEVRTATKLDVARLVANLRELSLAVDRDFNKFREENATEEVKIKQQLASLERKLDEQVERIDRQSQQNAAWERKIQGWSLNLEKITNELKRQQQSSKRRMIFSWVFNIMVIGGFLFVILR
ncbi:MAG TPA: hypothetical protein VHY08_06145 [Bacillota bacterium]|nr:hypothetical protein [Bacillota bacterium]